MGALIVPSSLSTHMDEYRKWMLCSLTIPQSLCVPDPSCTRSDPVAIGQSDGPIRTQNPIDVQKDGHGSDTSVH